MWQQIELHSIQTNMQRAGRQAKKDNTNGAKSSKGSANANQNVININLGDLMEKHTTTRRVAAPKKRAAASAEGEPARKQPKITDQQMDRLKRLKQEYTKLTRSTDMRMIPEGCRDVPDRLLHPRSPEQVRELGDYLESCINNIGLRSAQGIRPVASGIRAAPSTATRPIPGITGPTVPTTPFYQLSGAPLTVEEQDLKEELPVIIAELRRYEEMLVFAKSAGEKKTVAEGIKGLDAYTTVEQMLPELLQIPTSNEGLQELQQQASTAFDALKQALADALGSEEEPEGPPQEPADDQQVKAFLKGAISNYESFNIQLERAMDEADGDPSAVGGFIEQQLDNTKGKEFVEESTKYGTMITNDPEIQSLQNQLKGEMAKFKVLMEAAMGTDYSNIIDTPPPGTQPLPPDTPLRPELASAIKQFRDNLRVYEGIVDSLLEKPSIDRLNRAYDQFKSLQLELNADPLNSNENQKRQEVRDLGNALRAQLERYAKPYEPNDYVHQINSSVQHQERRGTFAKVISVESDGFLRVVTPIIEQGVVVESEPYRVSPRYVMNSNAGAYEAYEQDVQNQIATPPPKQPPGGERPPWTPPSPGGEEFPPVPPLPKPGGGFPSTPKKPGAPGESP